MSIIRLWRRRASKQRELREQRQIVANAALSSLSLGPPIRKAKDVSFFIFMISSFHATIFLFISLHL